MRTRKLPVVTVIILILNILGFVYELKIGENRAAYDYAMYQGALNDGQYLRAITCAFMHYGILHLVCNMICLLSYGFDLENKIGSFKYALIYIAGIIGSALLVNYTGGRSLHAGASGAIWGLMTATLVYNLRHGLNPANAFRGIILNLIYSFSAGISWQGHIGGGVAGVLAAIVLCGQNQDQGQQQYYDDDGMK